jgi:hypothetical protein
MLQAGPVPHLHLLNNCFRAQQQVLLLPLLLLLLWLLVHQRPAALRLQP